MTYSLSASEARKLVLLSQWLPTAKKIGRTAASTRSVIEQLGYIQIDTISVVERAHHHTLWNRNPGYSPSHLDQLLDQKRIFEYWSHAAAYLPMRDYRFSLPRKQAIASGEQTHWYEPDRKLMDLVLHRIASEGPLMAKDFSGPGTTAGGWQRKPAKRALECLFMQGELMVPCRRNFHKVYELTERVLPEGVDTSLPSREEYCRYLISGYLRANGLGQVAEISYLMSNIKSSVESTMEEMILAGEVVPVRVNGKSYYALCSALDNLGRKLSRSKLKILSPFDNLVIQRKRMTDLFGFDYLLECYLPQAKRRYGYFSLPILWDGKLVARMDCKAERKNSTLHLLHLVLEPGLAKVERFVTALSKELQLFMKFNSCNNLQLHRISPVSLQPLLHAVVICQQEEFTRDASDLRKGHKGQERCW